MNIIGDGGSERKTERRRKQDILTAPDKPAWCEVRPDSIPGELRDRPQWVAWRWQRDKRGMWTKVPIDAKTGNHASTTNPATWAEFAQALAYYEAGKADGIGYVFAEDD